MAKILSRAFRVTWVQCRTAVISGALLAFATAIAFGFASGATYLVKPDGTGDFPDIQAAIQAAAAGDVIELADGVFTGAGNRDIRYMGKAITLRSRSGDPRSCTIDCQCPASGSHRAFDFNHHEGSSSILEGVTITNASYYWGGGIHCLGEGTSPRISRCVFLNNQSPESEGGGICCDGDPSPLISDCLFAGNSASAGGAISVTNGYAIAGPTITGCTFYENSADWLGGGVRL
jgi:predicted outer membrane repeat protein